MVTVETDMYILITVEAELLLCASFSEDTLIEVGEVIHAAPLLLMPAFTSEGFIKEQAYLALIEEYHRIYISPDLINEAAELICDWIDSLI